MLAARGNGRLHGVLPLERRHRALASPANWHTPEFAPLTDGADAARALARSLFAAGCRRVTLAFVTEGDAIDACRTAATAAHCRLIVRTLERSPYVPVSGDWAAYEARRDSKLLRELRRRRRRLEEQGRLSLEVADGGARLDELLDEGFAVEAAGWKGQAGTAILSERGAERFYRSVARWAAARGSLRLAFLRLDARPLAFDFGIEEDSVHYLLKTGYDPAYRAFAPGMLLRREMLSRAFLLGLARYELLGADEPWKLSWAESTRARNLMQAFAASPLGIVDWAAWSLGRPFVRRVMSWRRT